MMGPGRLLICLVLLLLTRSVSALEVHGIAQARVSASEDPESWLYGGSGLYRDDASHDGLDLGQVHLALRQELGRDVSAHLVASLNNDPDFSPGLTQAFLRYQPLSSGLRWRLDVGAFYPGFSLENPGVGWTSPYLYSNSAINAWIGEEIRTVGGELSVSRPGRRARSPHSFTGVLGVFKANDPAGSLLAWRGFAVHDRQSLLNESIPFADNPAFDTPQLSRQANEVQPFSEVDGRFGYYLGAHWDYLKRSELRVYYYDNRGDPGAVNWRTGQYAWDTTFVSAAWLHKLTARTRLIAQWLVGTTAMGENRGLNNDFDAWYLLLSHERGAHRLSLRYDYFRVMDRDAWAFDPNDSHGESIAFAWRYDMTERWQLGVEASYLESFAANRALWWEPLNASQARVQGTLQYRF